MITPNRWSRYKSLVNRIRDSFNKDILVWRKVSAATIPQYFEDDLFDSYTDINLEVLFGYNYFRTWPVTKDTIQGAQDEQNMVVHINKDYLKGLGYLTADGYFQFNPEDDTFFHRGIIYKAFGDTFHSQASDDPLFIQLILKRDVIATGTDRHSQS